MKSKKVFRWLSVLIAVLILVVAEPSLATSGVNMKLPVNLAMSVEAAVTYYPRCDSRYTSLVDALNSIGVNSSYSNRKSIAQMNGITNYTGTAAQNTSLLNLLKQGKLIKSKTADTSGSISLSASSVSLNLNGTKSKTITVSHQYSRSCHYSYETSGNSGYAALSWGSWNSSGTACPLTITGQKAGSFNLRVKLVDGSTGNVVATTGWITVTVTGSQVSLTGSIYLSVGSVTLDLNGTKSQSITVSHQYSRSCHYSYETSGNSGYAALSWGSWNSSGTACPLTISGQKTGSFQLRVKLVDGATGNVVATTGWITVTVRSTTPSVSYETYYVTANSGLILRSGRGTNYNKILTMPYGSEIAVESGSISGGWAKAKYNGNTGYCSTTYISKTKPSNAKVTLNVPIYRQYDSRWANVKIGTKTIKQIGCTTTCIAMKYSYHTGTATYPNLMKKKLSYSNNDIIWSSVQKLGYTLTGQYKTKITNDIMKTIYNQLKKGRPVIVGGIPSASSSSQHWIVVTGYKGNSNSSFSSADFTIIDPNSTARTTLKDFLSYKPYIYRMVY